MSDSESSSESFYSCQEAVSEQEPDLESVPEPVSTDSVAFVTQEPYVSPPSDQPISYITFLSSPLSHNYHDLVSPTLFHTPVHTGSHHGFQSQPFLFTANNTEDLPTVHSSDIPDISIASSLCSSPITFVEGNRPVIALQETTTATYHPSPILSPPDPDPVNISASQPLLDALEDPLESDLLSDDNSQVSPPFRWYCSTCKRDFESKSKLTGHRKMLHQKTVLVLLSGGGNAQTLFYNNFERYDD